MANIIYLHHSGFAVELERYVLIFDDCVPDIYTPPKKKQLIVFASHKHQDHFQLKTLQWAEQISKNTRYFVGSDIKLNEKYLERKGMEPSILQRMVRMKGGAVYACAEENFKIETLRSTDQGVAFLVYIEGISVYHAGDLNHWYWEGESASWNRQMESAYRKEIDRIAGKTFDIAFVVLDPRLGAGCFFGMDYFLQKVSAKKVFPMHMWDNYDVVGRYKKTCVGKQHAEKIMEVSEINRTFFV